MMRNQKGFTLIDLMIVIFAVGSLAGVAIPQFAKYKAKQAAPVAEMQKMNSPTTTLQAR